VSDETARKAALDVSRSFIVQAPAGSGKTELLIQRYLALLASVEVPEQIVAITFTRKAAAEMRARILGALKNAAARDMPAETHRRETHALALQALRRDEEQGWEIIEQPQRLRIDTLDALNAWLAQQLPMLSGGVAGAGIMEDARDFYSLAARRLVEQLGDSTPVAAALERLLRYTDSGVERLEGLLARLLPTRDQWLGYLLAGDEDDLLRRVERAVRRLIDDELTVLENALPPAVSQELVSLLQHAARHAVRPSSLEKFAPWRTRVRLPPPDWRHLDAWQSIHELLLTRQGRWRARASDVGFSAEHAAPRQRFRDLIASLSGADELRLALLEAEKLPRPVLDTTQWEVLGALRLALHHLVGELKLLFAERNTVDFVELALAAQKALGDVDAPSELLLALDRRLQHVLVDEFQDTSHTQLSLLELLTAGWEQSDGRTLFLVGDPMQSIYRFRNADMSLFLNAKHRGVGEIRCESLVLERNFRSRPALIDWINGTFAEVFPQQDDPRTGAASFKPCTGTRTATNHQGVRIHALRGTDPAAEVRRVAEILVEERARAAQSSVAILVQSRHHLAGLSEQLRPLDLPVHAVEIDAPNHQQIIQDLMGLTRALAHLGDRIAWLGVLHAPWCGLTWRDLHALCWDDRKSPLWTLMNDPERLERLSPNGQDRLTRTRGMLQLAFRTRAEQPFARWVERAWMSLEGPACLDFPEELERADRFFLTLADCVTHGDLDDPAQLERRFTDPRVGADPPREKGIEIMTIHRAKGLEFDTVVLLGLGRDPPPEEARGLHWLERSSTAGSDDILLAPLAANSQQRDSLTEWLRRMDRLKDLSERARLLYVATTRARERLHLVGQLPQNKSPSPRSLLTCLWPCVSQAFEEADSDTPVDDPGDLEIHPVLRRLDEPAQAPGSAQEPPPDNEPRLEFEWAGQTAVQVGTVVHRWLHLIAEAGVDEWHAERVAARVDRFRAELRLLGVEKKELSWATARVVRALQQVLEDSRGRWVLTEHVEARSELAVTVVTEAGLEHLRLDRTFVDDLGVRWIIDFKTSAHEGGATEEFLSSEVERYRSQLERYALATSRIDNRPVRVGLYFPLLQAFKDWEPEQGEVRQT